MGLSLRPCLASGAHDAGYRQRFAVIRAVRLDRLSRIGQGVLPIGGPIPSDNALKGNGTEVDRVKATSSRRMWRRTMPLFMGCTALMGVNFIGSALAQTPPAGPAPAAGPAPVPAPAPPPAPAPAAKIASITVKGN